MEDCFVLDEPIVVVSTINIEKYKYELMNLKPHLEVSYQVWCYNSKDEFVKHFIGKIEGEEYSAWGNDDKYLDDLIKTKVLQKFTS
jgi:hypothetical protein